eukprot:Pgem_evm1s7231
MIIRVLAFVMLCKCFFKNQTLCLINKNVLQLDAENLNDINDVFNSITRSMFENTGTFKDTSKGKEISKFAREWTLDGYSSFLALFTSTKLYGVDTLSNMQIIESTFTELRSMGDVVK